MKILLIHPSVELYGADKILLYILDIFNKQNHQLTVLLPKNGVLVEYIKNISNNINIIIDGDLPIIHSKLGIKGLLLLPKKIVKFSKQFQKNSFDLVYCNTLAVAFCLYNKFAKIKLIHIHEIIENFYFNLLLSILVRLQTKNVICVSEHVRKNLFFSKYYKVIHNGIPDIPRKETNNFINDKLQFVLPGRIMQKKGQWFVLDALKQLEPSYLNRMHITFFGSPPPNRMNLKKEFEDYVKIKGLSNYVTIKNFVEDISQIYITANIIVVPSLMADPFPTTVLEALMYSRPVISTDNGGSVEILQNDYSKLIRPNDVTAFASAIKYFIDNTNELECMSLKARKKYENYLTIDDFNKRILSFINSIYQEEKR